MRLCPRSPLLFAALDASPTAVGGSRRVCPLAGHPLGAAGEGDPWWKEGARGGDFRLFA